MLIFVPVSQVLKAYSNFVANSSHLLHVTHCALSHYLHITIFAYFLTYPSLKIIKHKFKLVVLRRILTHTNMADIIQNVLSVHTIHNTLFIRIRNGRKYKENTSIHISDAPVETRRFENKKESKQEMYKFCCDELSLHDVQFLVSSNQTAGFLLSSTPKTVRSPHASPPLQYDESHYLYRAHCPWSVNHDVTCQTIHGSSFFP